MGDIESLSTNVDSTAWLPLRTDVPTFRSRDFGGRHSCPLIDRHASELYSSLTESFDFGSERMLLLYNVCKDDVGAGPQLSLFDVYTEVVDQLLVKIQVHFER